MSNGHGTNGSCILLVEDHPESRRATARLLRMHGHTVHEARGFGEAMVMGAEHRCDLLVCDIVLPDGSGFDLFRRLRQLYPVRGIAVTGREVSDQECRQAGFRRCISKPIRFSDLLSTIDEVTAERPSQN